MVDRKMCSPPSPSSNPMPTLLFHDSYSDAATFSTAPFNNKSYQRSIPELRGKRIVASQFGWLILLDDTHQDVPAHFSLTLLNPVTSKSIKLPPLMNDNNVKRLEGYLLTAPPNNDNDDSNCIVFVYSYDDYASFCQYQRKRKRFNCRWVSKRTEIEGQTVYLNNKAVALNGVICDRGLYWFYPNIASLISIEIIRNSLTLTPFHFSQPLQDDGYYYHQYVVESCGNVYIFKIATHRNGRTLVVKVWELDFNKGISIEVKSVGDRAFFLSDKGCTWCWSSNSENHCEGVQRNSVYIYDWFVTGEAVVMYLFDDCSLTFLPSTVSETPCSIYAFWVMPKHERSLRGLHTSNLCYSDSLRSRQHGYVSKPQTRFMKYSRVLGSEGSVQVSKPCRRVGFRTRVNMKTRSNIGSKAIEKDRDVSKSYLEVSTIKCKKLPQQNEPQGDYLSELPQHLTELLSSYLHLFDYWSFRRTSKMIQSAIPSPLWRTNNLFPLFLVFKNGGLCRLMDPCRLDSRFCIVPFIEDYLDIKFSKDGWLLVSDGKTLRFFNPFTWEKGVLPPINRSFDLIGFSTNPTCSNCLTITVKHKIGETVISYLKFGDLKWSTCRFIYHRDIRFWRNYSNLVYHSSAFYVVGSFGHLGVFKLVDEDTSWRVYDSAFPEGLYNFCYLVVCGVELFSVFIERERKYVVVFSFEHSQKKWVDVESLGNYTLFIRTSSCFSVATKDPKMKNRIYLPVIKGNHIVYYSLETKKYHVDNSEASIKNLFYTKFPSCCWI